MKKTLLLFVFVLTALLAKAQGNDIIVVEDANTQTAYVTFKTDKNGNRISNSYSGDVVIPEKTASGYPVTFINHETFEGCINLTSVTIPKTMKFIDYDAFRNSSLTELTIPASVDSISEGAFFGMPSLKKVVFEDGESVLHFACGQQYGGEGQFSFKHQESLEEAYIGRTYTTTWGDKGHLDAPLFKMSESIKKVTFGDYVKAVNPDDFIRCYKLETVVFGKGIETIGESAFEHCEKLSSINLAEGVKRIEKEAFYECTAATTLSLPQTLEYIGWAAFENCKSISELTIPASVTKIEDEAFLYMESLKKVTIADGTSDLLMGYGMSYGGEGMFKRQPLEEAYLGRTIVSEASGLFRGNETLAKVTVGQDVKSLNTREFAYCDKMASISTLAVVPPACQSSTFADIDKSACKLTVPAGTVDAYKVAEGWKEFFNIEAGINGVQAGAANVIESYTLNGRRTTDSHRGLTIQRTSNGFRKIVVR